MYLSNISIAVAIKKKEELLWNKLKPSYVVIWQGHFTVLNPNIWRTLHKKVQTGILLLQRKTRSHAQLFWICESGLCFCGNRQQFELPDIRESRVAWTACTCKGEHVGIRTWEDCYFLMWKKSKHARSGIRTHASTRRPEYPNSSTIAITLSTDDLKSGAFDHSAILAPIKLLLFRK